MNTCKPLEARKWFSRKAQTNWAITIVVFILLLAILKQFNDWWLALAISGAAVFGLFFLYLDRRSIGIECGGCGRVVDSNTPWECGFKQCRNENTHAFPFINECEHCHFIPKAYECHHCQRLIFLSKDKQDFQFAKILIIPKFTEVKNVVGEKITAQTEEVRDLEHQLRKTELQKQIEIEKNKSVSGMKTAEQALEEEINAEANGGMTIYAIEARLKLKADKEFAKDEHKREQKHALIQEAIRKRME